MASLFRAWSQVDNFKGQDQVIFNWFVVGRQVPVFPYEELIEHYDETEEDCKYDQLLVNEFFTLGEVEELRAYLLNHHRMGIQVEEVLLPVRSGGLSYGLLLISGEKSFYILADEEDYTLSVAILGHFDVKEDKSAVPTLSNEDLRMGTHFLQKVFSYLAISYFEENDIMTVLKNIYAESGFRVQKDTQPSDQLNTRRINN